VIAKILDLPIRDFEQLKTWSDALAWTVEISFSRSRKEAANEAVIGLESYLRQRIAERRSSPGDDLLGQLIAVEEAGERLSETELIANLVQIFVAGHETTTNLIGNGMLALLRHPDQLAQLRADLSLLPSAVEEFLRYDSPANILFRVAREDIEVGGKQIEANQLVLNMLGAANHDPAVFDQPEELDITRQPNPQLSFGGGIHYCPGAPLARMEAQIAFECLLKRWSAMTVDESGLEWRSFINLRGLEHLPINVSHA
jgi:cytochrome P450